MSQLELGLIGNCNISALVDSMGRIVWGCFPRFDGDPVFCSLLNEDAKGVDKGVFAIEIQDYLRSEHRYLHNTAILVTTLYDRSGGAVEITDFAPRFRQYGRMFYPAMIIRRVRPLAGSPIIHIQLRPTYDYGSGNPAHTFGSNH
ncbi:MAG: glycoside hydrolase family 15 protein, partial [Gammaproteobacteria bacterium]|nr:glycoside hydrolase family 15 protein [Gammaproteobacteria bacterium]